jgi:hypothetical protein
MSSQVRELMASGFGRLRHEPTAKRIQAVLGGETVIDSTRAVLVWEPRRIVPSYAVPVQDVRGDLVPAGAVSAGAGADGPGDDVGVALADVTALRVLDPRVPFTVHSTAGEAVDLRAAGQVRPGAGFRPADPDLAGLVILDFGAFDAWYVVLDGARRARPVTPWSDGPGA